MRVFRRLRTRLRQNVFAVLARAIRRRATLENGAIGRRHSLDELRMQLAAFDGFDLAAGIAGLMLLPENADRLVRLEAAAEIAATLSADATKPRMGADQWRAFLNDSWLSRHVGGDEDSFSGLFTKSVSYTGGSFVVFQGLGIDPVSTLSTLARAIAGGPAFPDAVFEGGTRAIISAVLRLSDAIAGRAGLGRGVSAARRDSRDVLIPDGPRLETLKEAVTFTRAELVAMLGDQALLRLGPLVTAFDAPAPYSNDPLGGALHMRPVLLNQDRIVVALPGVLASATVHAMLRMAGQDGLLAELHRRCRGVIFDIADRALRRLNATRISSEAWDVAHPVRCGIYQVDADAALVLYVAVDDFGD